MWVTCGDDLAPEQIRARRDALSDKSARRAGPRRLAPASSGTAARRPAGGAFEGVKTDASNATLPLPAALVGVLTAHRKRQLEERFEAGSERQDTGRVFTTATGGFIEPRNVNRMLGSLCDKAKIRRVRVHDLRHSCATLLSSMGLDAATVQRILRHSSIAVTTSTYVEMIENVQRDALDSMGVFFADEHRTRRLAPALRAGARQLLVGGSAALIVFGIGHLIGHNLS